jgi:hypothetical protein
MQLPRAPRLRLKPENAGKIVRLKRDILRYAEGLGWFSAAGGHLGVFVGPVSTGGRMQALVLLSVGGVQAVVPIPPDDLEIPL